jgi:hypothetical protein
VAFTAIASPAWSIPLADVGGIDLLLASTKLADSGEATEENWVKSVLGLDDLVFETKNDGAFSWQAVDGMLGVWAQGLVTDPAYYLVKTGKKSAVGPGHTHFLFDNLTDLSWAVVDLQVLGFDPSKVNFTKISHISEFSGAVEIPEPAVLALLAIGLLGLSVSRRRVK